MHRQQHPKQLPSTQTAHSVCAAALYCFGTQVSIPSSFLQQTACKSIVHQLFCSDRAELKHRRDSACVREYLALVAKSSRWSTECLVVYYVCSCVSGRDGSKARCGSQCRPEANTEENSERVKKCDGSICVDLAGKLTPESVQLRYCCQIASAADQ